MTRDSGTYAETIRQFWALFLGVSVERDGSVPGFDRWWTDSHPELREIGQAMARQAALRASSGGEDFTGIIVPAVTEFRRAVQNFRPARHEESPPAWTKFCGEIYARVLGDGPGAGNGWQPPQVLQALYGARDRFRAMDCPIDSWIAELERMGPTWRAT